MTVRQLLLSSGSVDSFRAFPFITPMSEISTDWLAETRKRMNSTAYFSAIGAEIEEISGRMARGRLVYSPDLVGDPDTGVVHGGVITALLDHLGGAAGLAAIGAFVRLVTLDLRIDYMKPAAPHADILAEAHCLKHTRELAFIRGVAYQTDPDDPIAICTATFMLVHAAASAPQSAGI